MNDGVQTNLTAESLFQRALEAHGSGRFSEAERFYRQSLRLAPAQLGARHNLASLLQGQGRLAEARDMLLAILTEHPDQQASLHALGVVLLDLGDYARGWRYFEARRNLPALNIPAPNLSFPEWQGEPLAGKHIVLFPEQGLGDNIQFARFAAVLRDQGAKVLLLSRPPLTALFAQSLAGIEVQSAEGKVELGEPDYWALVGSLPGRLGLQLNAIPNHPYLRAANDAPPRAPGPWRIGLTTKGNPAQANDARRSLIPAQAARLANLKDVEIVSLHPEDSGDFIQTSQIIAGLDLVISVDTSIGHLAGAMGKRAFVLVPGFNADWRWLRGHGGETTPWYPNHRLFRGDADSGWDDALARLEAAVGELANGSGAPAPPTDWRPLFERAAAAHARGNFAQAEALYRLAADADPGAVEPRLHLGALLRMLARPREARTVLEAGLALTPGRADLRAALGLVALTLGDFAAGWPLYEARREAGQIASPRLPIPEWDGAPPAGKRILVFPEQGLGDNILFSRFVLDLRDRGAEVLLLARPSLASLMQASFDGVEVQAAHGQLDLGAADAWVLIASLPGKLGVTLPTLSGAPYLRLPVSPGRPAKPFRIGLALSGNPANLNNERRNLPPETGQRLAAIDGVETISLQPQDTGAKDFADTAAVIAGLDLVVSVDTAIAHLAGAVGAPTIIMLPGYAADWRYLTDRDDSPWYASARLIRGAMDGDWTAALEVLEAEVTRRVRETLTKGPPPPT